MNNFETFEINFTVYNTWKEILLIDLDIEFNYRQVLVEEFLYKTKLMLVYIELQWIY